MDVVSVYKQFREFVEEEGEIDDDLSTYSKLVYVYADYVIVLDALAEREEDVVVAVYTKELVPIYYSTAYRIGLHAITGMKTPKEMTTPWRLECILNLLRGEINGLEDVRRSYGDMWRC